MTASHIHIVEVGPRDGLQNESLFVPTETKIEFVERLVAAGFRRVEVSSFVNPKWIPALRDAEAVMKSLRRVDGVEYSALVPNEQGLTRALACGVDRVNVFMSASETHNKRNINKTIDETFPVLERVVQGAKREGLPVRAYVSTVFGCPYEGRVSVEQVVHVVKQLTEMGIDELSLGDTIGVAVPSQVPVIVDAVRPIVPISHIALHFHDTRGTAMANVIAGLQAGVTTFDASLGGLGGCPYAPGASGNLATDDLVYMLQEMGYDTGLDSKAVDDVASWFEHVMNKPLASHARAVSRAAQQQASENA